MRIVKKILLLEFIALMLILIFNGCGNSKNISSTELRTSLAQETTEQHKEIGDISIRNEGYENVVAEGDHLLLEGEKHFKNIRQLTFGGDNAEAYFSFDNKSLVMQVSNPDKNINCDQIFTAPIPKAGEPFKPKLVSTGKGRTTCSYFMPGDSTVIYASTHLAHTECPPVPDKNAIGYYVWPLYPEFEIFTADLEGNIVKQYTDNDYYDAEATVSPRGDKIVYTSTKNGDIDLYIMDIDGSNDKQVTFLLGYDGGAFFTPDGDQLIFRASRPSKQEDIDLYKRLLKEDMVAPADMELMICDLDGGNLRQITSLGNANWAPFMHPSGEKVIFSSNHESQVGFPFNLYMINLDGTGLEQITYDKKFAAFPMFSFDGKQIVFASNRNNGGSNDTNVFIADWVE